MKATQKTLSVISEDTKEKLLKAAIRNFSEYGYKGATIRAICDDAGVNIALVKYHFGNKLALYKAVVREVTDADAKMATLTEALNDHSEPEAALRQIIHRTLERLIAKKELPGQRLRLMMKELVNPNTMLLDEVEDAIRPVYERFLSVIGRIVNLPPNHSTTRLCAHSIVGQITHYVPVRLILSRLWPEMQMTPKQIFMIANHIADFSLAYLGMVGNGPSHQSSKSSRRRGR